MSAYWDRYWSRRRMLGAAGIAATGAASMAFVGCGGDDEEDGGTGGTGGLGALATATPAAVATTGAAASPTAVDPFAGAVRGGTLRINITGDPPTIDPYGNLSFITKTMASYVYSRLFKYKTGPGILRADVRPTGDIAESASASPDGLKWTVKLKPGIKFHNVAPVNGRAVNVDDIKFSWGRLADPKNAASAQVKYIDKVEYPDASTIVFTLKSPNAVFLDTMADSNLLWIMPTEAEGGFDPAQTMIGSGPWLFDSYTPSVSYKMKRNPDWYDPRFPLMDNFEASIIPEYATYLAQFQAGNLDQVAPNANDLSDVQNGIKGVQISSYKNQGANWLWFDGNDPNSPYNKDERIRQAFSMACDRDALTDLAYNNTKLKAAGIKTEDAWNNLIPSGWGRFWLDPQSAAAGDSGKFFKYDPAEAKKLLSAAGFGDSNPLKLTYQYTANRYGKNFNDSAEATQGFLQAIGVQTTTDIQDYSSKYITQTFLGNFSGVAFGLETGFGEVGNYPIRLFTENSNNHGKVADPVLTKFAADQQIEQDDAKRVALYHEAQKYHAQKMYYIPLQVGAGQTWVAHRPEIRNGGDYYTLAYGAGTETYPYYWKAKA